MKTMTFALGAAAALGLATLALAGGSPGTTGDRQHMAQMQPAQGHQTHGGGMQGAAPTQANKPAGDQGPASLAFAAAGAKMHTAMAIIYTGKADVDFVRGMIPHHQGAIDMAKIAKAFGTDPEIKALADGIIKAQEAEIAQMEAWLKKNAK